MEGGHCYGGAPPYPQQQTQNPYAQQYNPSPSSQGPPPGVDPTLWQWFKATDGDNSGQITSQELQTTLLRGNLSQFNEETCRWMIGMFDKNRSGKIDIYEFAALWKYIQDWKRCFEGLDKDRSGNIDTDELCQAFTTFGYRLSMQFCQLCVRRFDSHSANTMKFDEFIQCCVMLKSLTDCFRKFDTNQNGVINVNYEQFMEMVLDNTLSGI